MNEIRDVFQDGLVTTIHELYGITSRADAETVAREVKQINDTIAQLSERYLNPLQAIMDFKDAMKLLEDETNSAY